MLQNLTAKQLLDMRGKNLVIKGWPRKTPTGRV